VIITYSFGEKVRRNGFIVPLVQLNEAHID
jgi:hypothetical protein